jgi:elongator complex protein 3
MVSSPKHREAKWLAAHGPVDMDMHNDQLLAIIQQVRDADEITPSVMRRILTRHPRRHTGDGGTTFSKHELVLGYRTLCEQGRLEYDRETLRRLQMKPTRTLSGVAPVTVLTKPSFCPGQCIFCPTEVRMPKSYLADEPGAMRAAYHQFDPYDQTVARLGALENIGHNTDKIELLILGGTWSAYPTDYQEWYVRRCLDAMNGQEATSLRQAQVWNASAPHRNVGLVIETRPDWITPDEIARFRRLGVTKVQLGVQSLDENILNENQRGHTVEQSRQAFRLLRLAGFKIAAHWMPNLLGATPESDREDFRRLWSDRALRPDELKIYPCVLLTSAPLRDHWQRGAYRPYDEDTLVELVADCKAIVPPYCRVNRITRDIPAPNILAGSTKANLRQLVQRRMAAQNRACRCIRCREVRREQVNLRHLRWETLVYATDVSLEYFLSATTPSGRLAGFLRLSLPILGSRVQLAPSEGQGGVFDEISNCAMIRQVHVYGPALTVGSDSKGEAQHAGIGHRLIERAHQIAQFGGYKRMAVIAATGTRAYYGRLGFELGELYMAMDLKTPKQLFIGGHCARHHHSGSDRGGTAASLEKNI